MTAPATAVSPEPPPHLSIREVSELVGLTDHTLRWYERIGLLDRVARGSDGRRRFSATDVEWLRLLTKLRETGMPVAQMREYAELVRSGAGYAERLELLVAHREQVREQIAAQQACLELLDFKIDNYRRTVRGPGEGA
ncbi:MerR family transcriptional regulator [Jatrophihabitans sp. YIM 134969]